jgi:hypothetical protein
MFFNKFYVENEEFIMLVKGYNASFSYHDEVRWEKDTGSSPLSFFPLPFS